MFIVTHKKLFLAIAAALMAFSVFAITFWGLNLGIEFTGGSLLEVRYPDGRPDANLVEEQATQMLGGDVLIQPTGENGLIIRAQETGEDTRSLLLDVARVDDVADVREVRYSAIGPSIGTELGRKALVAITIVALSIIVFIAFAFRYRPEGDDKDSSENTTPPVRSWEYGAVAVVALLHDILLPTGVFAFLGSLFVDAQIDVLFVTALLAILGYSVNDTIVVFDRVRENLAKEGGVKQRSFAELAGTSVRQTMARSINTSLTTLAVLLALFFLGGAATHNFALVLIVGVLAGTYSSIFLAVPLLVLISERKSSR